jgi:hypothetical protein
MFATQRTGEGNIESSAAETCDRGVDFIKLYVCVQVGNKNVRI